MWGTWSSTCTAKWPGWTSTPSWPTPSSTTRDGKVLKAALEAGRAAIERVLEPPSPLTATPDAKPDPTAD
jgi:hypothetical protein